MGTSFTYNGSAKWQLIEWWNGTGESATVQKTYVYGNYIDELIQVRTEATSSVRYAHQDDLFRRRRAERRRRRVTQRFRYGDCNS